MSLFVLTITITQISLLINHDSKDKVIFISVFPTFNNNGIIKIQSNNKISGNRCTNKRLNKSNRLLHHNKYRYPNLSSKLKTINWIRAHILTIKIVTNNQDKKDLWLEQKLYTSKNPNIQSLNDRFSSLISCNHHKRSFFIALNVYIIRFDFFTFFSIN